MLFGKPKSFYLLLHPRPVIVVSTRCPNGRVNLAPIAWITPVAEDEPTIALAVDRSNYTCECIEYCKEAVINIPSIDQAEIVYKLGTTSGREVDKVSSLGIKLESSNKVSVPRWADALGWIEVKLRSSIDIGEVRLFIMDVLDYYAKQDAVTEWGWNLSRTSPLLHVAGRAFASVGRRVFVQR